ncbi:MAG: hypothetical protein IJC04_10855 [Oscillospiraceae bacterium]|nr:hypothetical protein [Oscillospiraceae bacterium]
MHIVIYGVYLLARILGYRHFKKTEEDDPNINIKTTLYSTKKFLSFFILPIFWLLFATLETSVTFIIGLVIFIICFIMAISKNSKLILISLINIGELFFFGLPSLMNSASIFSFSVGDELYFLFWKILSW